jgi:hypothetical protein
MLTIIALRIGTATVRDKSIDLGLVHALITIARHGMSRPDSRLRTAQFSLAHRQVVDNECVVIVSTRAY